MKPRILLLDIETSMALGYFFGRVWETNIVRVKQQTYMLSFAVKWLGESKVHTHALPDFKGYNKDLTNDEPLVLKLAEYLDQAETIIAHNGDSFDLPTINTRLLKHCQTPPSPYKTVDTLKIARRKFKFPSNKLDDLADYLGVGRKLATTGKDLWERCMDGDPKAWEQMRRYNAQDVVLLEKVYLKLRAWGAHPNINLNTRKHGCPTCGSTNFMKRGHVYTMTTEAQRFNCMDCGKWFSDTPEKIGRIHLK